MTDALENYYLQLYTYSGTVFVLYSLRFANSELRYTVVSVKASWVFFSPGY